MAISFIGSAEGSSSPNAATSVTLPGGITANDLIIAAFAVGDDDNVNTNIAAPTLTGVTFTEVADLSHTADGDDIDLGVFYGYYSGSDTTLDWAAVGGTDASNASVIMVFRGVQQAADGGPFDVAATTVTGQDVAHPNPPSINHNNPSGLWTVIVGATSHVLAGGTQTYTFPTGYTTDAIDRSHADTNCVTVGMGYRNSGISDPEDPGTMTFSGATAATNSWAAVTMALKEATVANADAEVAFTELEVPNAQARADLAWAEFEVPNAQARADVAWAEFEVPNAEARADVAWAELEVPDVPGDPADAEISWAEFEVPNAQANCEVSWAEFEVPNAEARADVSWAEFEVPNAQADAEIAFSELEVPTAQARADVSWAEFEVPDVGSGETARPRWLYWL